jgi:hypothetical protein
LKKPANPIVRNAREDAVRKTAEDAKSGMRWLLVEEIVDPEINRQRACGDAELAVEPDTHVPDVGHTIVLNQGIHGFIVISAADVGPVDQRRGGASAVDEAQIALQCWQSGTDVAREILRRGSGDGFTCVLTLEGNFGVYNSPIFGARMSLVGGCMALGIGWPRAACRVR